jgi:hypothetical protein
MTSCLAGEIPAGVFPECHASTPYEVKKDCQPNGPEDDETYDHHRDPSGFAVVVELSYKLHGTPHVNVINIHIYARVASACQDAVLGQTEII